MAEENTIDARGLSCPQPALMARQALKDRDKGTVEFIVDNQTARENVSRTARNLGWKVETSEISGEEIHLVMIK